VTGGVGYTLLIGKVPAPQPLVDAVELIEVDASLELASALRVRFGITQTEIGDWSVLETDLFRPLLPLDLRIQTGILPPLAVINAFVSGAHVVYADEPGQSALEVTAMDATAVMNLQEKVMPWPCMPDSAIAAAIFGQYALVPKVQPTPPTLVEPEGTITQRGSDIRFLRRLAARNGFDCYVQPEPLTGLDFGYFQPSHAIGVPDAVLNVNMGVQTNVRSFGVRYDMLKPTTVLAAGVDVATKAPQPALAPVSTELPLGLEPTLTRVLPPPIARPADTGLFRTGELQVAAQAIADRSSWALVAEGEVGSDVAVLHPGGFVNVRGAGRVYNGSYLVTRVRHSIARDRYTQRFEARRNAVEMTGAELYMEL
jgi:hypothetical protein